MLQSNRSHFSRMLCMVMPMVLVLPLTLCALEPDDADKIRDEIMKMVQDRMKRDRDEMMSEIERILKDATRKTAGKQDELEQSRRQIAELEQRIAELTVELARLKGTGGNAGRNATPSEPAILGFAFEPADAGIRVTVVLDGSPAASILKAGDVVSEVDGKKITAESFGQHMTTKKPGDRINIKYARQVNSSKREMEASTRLVSRGSMQAQIDRLMERAGAELPPETPRVEERRPRQPEAAPSDAMVSLGITVRQENYELTVIELEPNSNCAEAGIREGDMLLGINDKRVTTVESVRDALAQMRVGQEVAFLYQRGDTRWLAKVVLGGGSRRPVLKSTEKSSEDQGEDHAEEAPRGQGFLGIQLGEGEGIVVGSVEPNSAASRMGLQPGDQIIEMNGTTINGLEDLRGVLGDARVGDAATVKVRRGGTTKTLKAELGPRPDPQAQRTARPAPRQVAKGPQGTEVKPAAENVGQLAQSAAKGPVGLGITAELQGEAIHVVEVFKNGAAAKAGLKVGDHLVRVDGVRLKDLDTLKSAVQGKAQGESVSFRILREGERHNVNLALAPLPMEAIRMASANDNSSNASAMKSAPKQEAKPAGKPFLGVELEQLADGSGLSVVSLEEGPCRSAGWKPGDLVVSFAGKSPRTLEQMRDILSTCRVGREVSTRLKREGREVDVAVTLTPRAE